MSVIGITSPFLIGFEALSKVDLGTFVKAVAGKGAGSSGNLSTSITLLSSVFKASSDNSGA